MKKEKGYGDRGIKELLLKKQGWRCYYCGYPFSINMDGWNNMTIDHVYPQSKGIDNSVHNENNLVIACSNCNSSKNSNELYGSKLVMFKQRRSVLRARDEVWVSDIFNWTSSNRSCFSPDNINELSSDYSIEVVHDEMKKYKEEFNNIKIRSEYLEFSNNGKVWTFEPETFSLQAYFIHSEDIKREIDYTLNLILERFGYIKGAGELRTKYLKPFNSVEDGINIIKNEIEFVNKTWRVFEGNKK